MIVDISKHQQSFVPNLTQDNSVVISCEIIRDEVEFALEPLAYRFETIWTECGLHNVPKNLARTLQEIIDANQDREYILLAFCLCGQGVCGITSLKSTLAIPRFDDCIAMLRCVKKGIKPKNAITAYYLTRGWLDFFYAEENSYIDKYGKEGYENICDIFYGNYETLSILETGAFERARIRPSIEGIAKRLRLNVGEEIGSTRILTKLFSGTWDDEIIVYEPGMKIEMNDFMGLS